MPNSKRLTANANNRLASKNIRDEVVSDALFDSMGEGAIIVNEKGNISRVNKVAMGILGYTKKDLLGNWHPATLVAEDTTGNLIANSERPITEAFLKGRPVAQRLYYRKKNGERVAVALNVSPIIFKGKPIGAIQLFRDITDEIRLDRAKDDFISIASHQLRTPATVVKQNLGLILEGYVNNRAQQLELLRTAYEHNENQLEIINNLLNIAELEAEKMKVNVKNINLNNLLDRAINTQAGDYTSREIKLKLVSKDKATKVLADPLHLQMIFENLLNNAQKYSRPKSQVTVKITQGRKYVNVDVRDRGHGIDTKDIPALFRKFSRARNASSLASGTGLGLYWAKKLIELNGGNISLKSKLNEGTTFRVGIPKG